MRGNCPFLPIIIKNASPLQLNWHKCGSGLSPSPWTSDYITKWKQLKEKNIFPSPEGSDYCPTLQGLNNEYVDYCVVVSFCAVSYIAVAWIKRWTLSFTCCLCFKGVSFFVDVIAVSRAYKCSNSHIGKIFCAIKLWCSQYLKIYVLSFQNLSSVERSVPRPYPG